MKRNEIVLAALAAAEGGAFSPVQVQKLFFLLDRNIAEHIGGRQFEFEPYDYGPFDSRVYSALEELARDGLVEIESGGSGAARRYLLSERGLGQGREKLNSLPVAATDYMRRAVSFVRSVSFSELVSAIYKAYPEMKVNSVFKG